MHPDLGIWGEMNDRVFRGRERYHSEVWSLVRFCPSGLQYWRPFVTTLLLTFYLVWSLVRFWWAGFFVGFCILLLFLNQSC